MYVYSHIHIYSFFLCTQDFILNQAGLRLHFFSWGCPWTPDLPASKCTAVPSFLWCWVLNSGFHARQALYQLTCLLCSTPSSSKNKTRTKQVKSSKVCRETVKIHPSTFQDFSSSLQTLVCPVRKTTVVQFMCVFCFFLYSCKCLISSSPTWSTVYTLYKLSIYIYRERDL